MNARVLELVKNPQLVQSEDLKTLEAEIKKFPYAQHIRALYLLGISRHRSQNYQKVLSETAAYTTDKKILYHLINKAEKEDLVEGGGKTSESTAATIVVSNKFVVDEILEVREQKAPKPVFVNGELNRILFEGEEGFLNRKTEKIDLKQTLESGTLVTEKLEKVSEVEPAEESVVENSPHPIQDKKSENDDSEIPQHKQKAEITTEEGSQLSYHGVEHFLPTVALSPVIKKQENYQPKQLSNRHDDEMKKLIAEVEAKMKAKKSAERKRTLEANEAVFPNNEISFAEPQAFLQPEKVEKEIRAEDKHVKQIAEEPETNVNFEPEEPKTSWKPMSFASNMPDALILESKTKPEEEITNVSTDEAVKTINSKDKAEEKETIPVMNVSFFPDTVSKIEAKEEVVKSEKRDIQPEESNVPQFINTWQNWLQIDRSLSQKELPVVEEKTQEQPLELQQEEIKEKAIEKFIESEPKISKLKEESNYVVKEKAGDISHLMTETLAKLYVEQKLYAKAINAYEILQKKHPEKKKYFSERIEEIKHQKTNK